MRFTIGKRIFAALTATSLIIVILSALATRWSFQRGFENYVAEQEVERLEELAADLADVYRDAGTWDVIRQDRRIWDELLRPPNDRFGNAPARGFPPRPPGSRPGPMAMGGPPGAPMGAPPPPPPPDPLALRPRLTLIDAEGVNVIGRPERSDSARRLPIVVDGEVAGTLLIEEASEITAAIDLQFAADQGRSTLYISLAILVFAGIVALIISRQMVRPITRLTGGARALTGGSYSHRLTVTRDDEIGDLARDFNTLATTLEENRRMRRQWVADISHDLRTPLTILSGELQALEYGVRTFDEDTLKSLQSEVAHLRKLVADLHELTISDEGGLKIRSDPVDVVAILRDTLESSGNRIEDAGITLQLQIPEDAVLIDGDEQRLAQLFTNLIENTIRYTDAPGLLRIEIADTDEKIVIRFADSAPGVSPEHLPRLFDRLYRADSSRNRETGGSGLGLAICESIVTGHGGEISAAASKSGGIEVTITFNKSASGAA